MNKRVVIAIVVVVVLGALIISPLGLGIIGGDDSASGGNEADSGGSEDLSNTDNETNDENLEELVNEVDEEEAVQMYEEWLSGPGLTSEFYDPVDDDTPLPPGVGQYLKTEEFRKNTISTASNEPFVFNFYREGTNLDDDELTYAGAKVDPTEGEGIIQTVEEDGDVSRTYFSGRNAVRQTVTFENNGRNDETAIVNNQSVEQPSAEEYVLIDELLTAVEHGSFQPAGYTVIEEDQITVLQSEFANEGDVLASQIEPGAELLSYGGEVHLDEFGSLLQASITFVYETPDGEQHVRSIAAEMKYGPVDTSQPGWVPEEPLTQPSGNEVELIDNQYLRVQPEEPISEGAEVELSTATGTYTTTLPSVGVDETLYLYLEDGKLQAEKTAPDTEEYIGVDYSLFIFDTDGTLVLSHES